MGRRPQNRCAETRRPGPGGRRGHRTGRVNAATQWCRNDGGASDDGCDPVDHGWPSNSTGYEISHFSPNPFHCEGDTSAIYPVVVRPEPFAGSEARSRLHAAVDELLEIDTHYRLYTYTDAAGQYIETWEVPSPSDEYVGEIPAQSASYIWLALKRAGVVMEGTRLNGEDLEDTDVALGAQVASDDPQDPDRFTVEDGLYFYDRDERERGAGYLHGYMWNLVMSNAAVVATPSAYLLANQFTNCFVSKRGSGQ